MTHLSKFMVAAIAVAVCGFAGLEANAYDITWSVGADFTDPEGHQNISTAGVHIQAINFGEDVDHTVTVGTEDITFEGLEQANSAPNTFDGTPYDNDGFNPGSSSFPWNAVMDWNNWSTTNTGDFQLTGLSIGNTYQIEIFVFDRRSTAIFQREQNWRDQEGNTSGNFQIGRGISTIGTFVADAGTELISGTMLESSAPNPAITAYSLRQLAEVPEPGSMVVLIPLGFGIALRRRRR